MGFFDDDRAVSPILAFILVAGLVVLGISIYQASILPNQNEEIEFKHSQRVQDDLVHVRNAVMQAYETGENQFVTVELGTNYPVRLVGVNPPPPTGSIRTSGADPVSVEDGSGTTITDSVCPGDGETRALAYVDGYNAYRNAPKIRYENTVLYKRFNGSTLTMTDQALVENDTINLVLLTGRYSRQGTDAVSIDFEAGTGGETSVTDPVVTVPTRLDESTWEELLDGTVDASRVSVADGNLTLDLSGSYTVSCAAVGIHEQPPSVQETETQQSQNDTTTLDQGTGASVFIHNVSDTYGGQGQTSPKLDVRFDNRASEEKTIVAARFVTFYQPTRSHGCSGCVEMVRIGGSPPDLVEGEPKQTLDTPVTLSADTTTAVTFHFKAGNGDDYDLQQDDFYVVMFEFDDGTTSMYFVQVAGGN